MECEDRGCRDGIYARMDEIMQTKADKLSKPAVVSIISLIIMVLIFIGGGPLMYSISSAKDRQKQISKNHEEIRAYSVKQDTIIYNQQEAKKIIEKINERRERDLEKIDVKLESLIKEIRRGK